MSSLEANDIKTIERSLKLANEHLERGDKSSAKEVLKGLTKEQRAKARVLLAEVKAS